MTSFFSSWRNNPSSGKSSILNVSPQDCQQNRHTTDKRNENVVVQLQVKKKKKGKDDGLKEKKKKFDFLNSPLNVDEDVVNRKSILKDKTGSNHKHVDVAIAVDKDVTDDTAEMLTNDEIVVQTSPILRTESSLPSLLSRVVTGNNQQVDVHSSTVEKQLSLSPTTDTAVSPPSSGPSRNTDGNLDDQSSKPPRRRRSTVGTWWYNATKKSSSRTSTPIQPTIAAGHGQYAPQTSADMTAQNLTHTTDETDDDRHVVPDSIRPRTKSDYREIRNQLARDISKTSAFDWPLGRLGKMKQKMKKDASNTSGKCGRSVAFETPSHPGFAISIWQAYKKFIKSELRMSEAQKDMYRSRRRIRRSTDPGIYVVVEHNRNAACVV